jgi:hypothetical protein
LLWTGIVVSSLAFGAIVWGQLKPNVTVPHRFTWAHEPVVCADLAIDDDALFRAMSVLIDHGLYASTRLPIESPCPGRPAIHLSVSPADIDRVIPPKGHDSPISRGVYERKTTGDMITDCNAYVIDGTDVLAITHEIIHCFGYDHARNAPSGHIMHPDYERLGLRDFRGIP